MTACGVEDFCLALRVNDTKYVKKKKLRMLSYVLGIAAFKVFLFSLI